jgi:hypothetical protein
VTGDTSNAFSCLQAGFDSAVLGISQPGTNVFPDNSSSATQYAAISGQQLTVYGPGAQVQLTINATVTPFQNLKSDASGFGIPAVAGDRVAAIALEGGAALDIIQAIILPNGLTSTGTIFTAKTAATAQNTYTTGISIVTGMTGIGSLTLPANYFTVGKTIRVSGFGIISDTSTPTFQLTLKLGTVSLCATAATTLGSGISNKGLSFSALICQFNLSARPINALTQFPRPLPSWRDAATTETGNVATLEYCVVLGVTPCACR